MKQLLLRAIAIAMLSVAILQVQLVYAQNGTGLITITANNGSCLGFTAAQGNGPDNWEIAEGGSYTMTITGVTECDGDAITVFIQSSNIGNFCFNASSAGDGTYIGEFTVPNPACFTMPISYKCGADQPCDNSNTYNANGPSNNNKVHLRASIFDGDCVRIGDDTICSSCVCIPPTNLTVDSISPAEDELCWDTVACAVGYIVAWRIQPQTVWIYATVDAPGHCRIFTNHFDDVYEIRIATICSTGDTSEYGDIFTFETFPSCLPPQDPYTNGITATKATLHWTGVVDASKYSIWYRKVGDATWTKKNIAATKTSLTLTGLLPSTDYEWKVQSKCIGATRTVGGAFTPVQHFTTAPAKLDQLGETIASVSLYPNPASDQFILVVEANDNIAHSMIVELVNVLGKVVYNTQPQAFQGLLQEQIDLHGISDGMYTVRITVDGQESFNQLLVQH